MASLWVAAAINADNEDVFYDESEFDITPAGETQGHEGADQDSVFFPEEEDSRPQTPAGPRQARPSSSRPSFGSSAPGRFRPSFGFGPLTQLNAPSPRPSHRDIPGTTPHQTPRFPPGAFGTPRLGLRRGSSTSNLGLPAIYNNTGLSSPPALAQDVVAYFDEERGLVPHTGGLSVISEGSGSVRLASTAPSVHPSEGTAPIMPDPIKEPSVWRQLPLVMIVQYGVLALHNVSTEYGCDGVVSDPRSFFQTVHDQYFLTYLVS